MNRFALPKIFLIFLLISAAIPPTSLASDLSLHTLAKSLQLASINQSVADGDTPLANHTNDHHDASHHVDLWARIRSGFGIPELKSQRVQKQLARYRSQQDYVQHMLDRSARYLFYIVQELEIRGMPTELALLPFIESAYNPLAKSPANAAGIWQFIPSTGHHFELAQSTLKDERQSILKSTDAALNYLQRLHSQFDDWHLALAAYNWGQGSLRHAIRKNEASNTPISFNRLVRHMPEETRNYLPKLQALKHLISTPQQYGIKLPHIENRPYFTTVRQERDMDVDLAARLAEMEKEEFMALNPQFGDALITGGPNTRLLLPVKNAEKFRENRHDRGEEKSLSSWTTYKITEDRAEIATIAKKFNVAPTVIRKANSIPPKMLLNEGSIILVPKRNPEQAANIAPKIVQSAAILMEHEIPVKKRIYVKVRIQDCLSTIAQRYQVKVSQIKKWNQLKNNRIVAGKKLKLYVLERYARL